jgi:hypothetical protein
LIDPDLVALPSRVVAVDRLKTHEANLSGAIIIIGTIVTIRASSSSSAAAAAAVIVIPPHRPYITRASTARYTAVYGR